MEMPQELRSIDMRLSPAYGLRDKEWRRQDPSNILKIEAAFYVWYARHSAHFKWNETRTRINGMEIWTARSEDGHHWTEYGPVLPPSKPGQWHERATHAPHVVPWKGRFYLFFSAFYGPYHTETRTGRKCIGMAAASHPHGPFKHVGEEPILTPSGDLSAFDYFLIDDACVIRRNGKFWLYYKGRNSDASECRLGVAEADTITGPYQRLGSDAVCSANWHTGCVWPHRQGVAGIVDNTAVAYSEDGLSFTLGATVPKGINDAGVFCTDAFEETANGRGISWGLALGRGPEHIFRFDAELTATRALSIDE